MVEKRGYSSKEEMNEDLIRRYNSVVNPQDHVYILGDFSFGNRELTLGVLKRLKGSKYLVRGNHDPSKFYHKDPEIAEKFVWVKDYHELKHNKKMYIMMHYPILSWRNMHYGAAMLHGHCHGNLKESLGKRLDVGVDTRPDLLPYSLDEIDKIMETRGYEEVDHHTPKEAK